MQMISWAKNSSFSEPEKEREIREESPASYRDLPPFINFCKTMAWDFGKGLAESSASIVLNFPKSIDIDAINIIPRKKIFLNISSPATKDYIFRNKKAQTSPLYFQLSFAHSNCPLVPPPMTIF